MAQVRAKAQVREQLVDSVSEFLELLRGHLMNWDEDAIAFEGEEVAVVGLGAPDRRVYFGHWSVDR